MLDGLPRLPGGEGLGVEAPPGGPEPVLRPGARGPSTSAVLMSCPVPGDTLTVAAAPPATPAVPPAPAATQTGDADPHCHPAAGVLGRPDELLARRAGPRREGRSGRGADTPTEPGALGGRDPVAVPRRPRRDRARRSHSASHCASHCGLPLGLAVVGPGRGPPRGAGRRARGAASRSADGIVTAPSLRPPSGRRPRRASSSALSSAGLAGSAPIAAAIFWASGSEKYSAIRASPRRTSIRIRRSLAVPGSHDGFSRVGAGHARRLLAHRLEAEEALADRDPVPGLEEPGRHVHAQARLAQQRGRGGRGQRVQVAVRAVRAARRRGSARAVRASAASCPTPASKTWTRNRPGSVTP